MYSQRNGEKRENLLRQKEERIKREEEEEEKEEEEEEEIDSGTSWSLLLSLSLFLV